MPQKTINNEDVFIYKLFGLFNDESRSLDNESKSSKREGYNKVVYEYACIYSELYPNALIPLHNESKICKYKYKSRRFDIDDFKEDDVTGIALILSRVDDLICIDVDCKHMDEDEILNVAKLIGEFVLKNKSVYLEKSKSGYHIFVKVKDRSLFLQYIREKYNSRIVAHGVEIFPDHETRYVVVAPSLVEGKVYQELYNTLLSVGYVDWTSILELINALRELLGPHRIEINRQKNISVPKKKNGLICDQKVNELIYDQKVNEPSTSQKTVEVVYDQKIIELIYDPEYVRLLTSKDLTRIRRFLFRVENDLKSDKKLLSMLFNEIGIEYEGENDKAYRVRSIFVDDGRYADAYIFKDSLIYKDFHFEKCNLQLIQYYFAVFPEKILPWIIYLYPANFFRVLNKEGKYLGRKFLKVVLDILLNWNVSLNKDGQNTIPTRDDKIWRGMSGFDVDRSLLSKFKKVINELDEKDKKKVLMKWLRGKIKDVFKYVEYKYIEMFMSLKYVLKRSRKYLKLYHSVIDRISVCENVFKSYCRILNIDPEIGKIVMEMVGFKYYRKHKKFVRSAKKKLEHFKSAITNISARAKCVVLRLTSVGEILDFLADNPDILFAITDDIYEVRSKYRALNGI